MLPLDEKYVEVIVDGKSEKIPSLHPRWKESMDFVSYVDPPLNGDQAEMEEWSERLGFIEEDLHHLLRMPHNKFWCQAVFDETLHRCIDSFLKNCPRSYDIVYNLPADLKKKHDRINKQFFLVSLRMATHKESKDHFITPSVFGDILYENFIFDIPKLMDLCALYGSSNGQLLCKMIGNIFTQQPKYQGDLEEVVNTIVHVFDNILQKCGVKSPSHEASPQKLGAVGAGEKSLKNMSLNQFQDVIFYLHDTSYTLWSFLDTYPDAVKQFSSPEFIHRLVYLYENVVPKLSEAFKEREWESLPYKQVLLKKMHAAQGCILKTFRLIMFSTHLRPVLEQDLKDLSMEEAVEGYLSLMTSLLSERRFAAHLEHLYPFADDIDIITQSSNAIDETRVEYIKEGIQDAYSVHGPKQRRFIPTVAATGDNRSSSSSPEPEYAGAAGGGEKYEEAGACAPRISGIELESLITSVKDLLPDLGEGFIELALEELNYSVEAVINTVLEDKLPPSLQDLDRTTSRIAPSIPLEEPEDNSALGQRRNVYDNDEFDVFKRDSVDTSRVHRGKKDKLSAGVSLLDDKSELDSLKELYSKYGSEFKESMYDVVAPNGNEYEDEYDDTYDFNQIGADDADSADELTTRRPFTMPRILGGKKTEDSEGPADVSDDEDEDQKPRDQFITDPAKLREQAAMRHASKMSRVQKKHQHHKTPAERDFRDNEGQGQSQGEGRKNYDVKGNPRGQGQEKDVTRNRAWKEKNKSSRVHHNRKNLADKKRKF